jgi:hypothetical protein
MESPIYKDLSHVWVSRPLDELGSGIVGVVVEGHEIGV